MSVVAAPQSVPLAVALNVFDAGRLYAVAEVVERTQFSRSVLYEEMKEGRLAYVKRGCTRRLLGIDVNAFLARHYRAADR